MFSKTIETFCTDVMRTLFKGASSTRHASKSENFFCWHIVVFCQYGLKSLEGLKIGSRSMGRFDREIVLNDKYLSLFSPDRKVLWMILNQLLQIFIKIYMLDCNRAACVLHRGQSQLLVPSESYFYLINVAICMLIVSLRQSNLLIWETTTVVSLRLLLTQIVLKIFQTPIFCWR